MLDNLASPRCIRTHPDPDAYLLVLAWVGSIFGSFVHGKLPPLRRATVRHRPSPGLGSCPVLKRGAPMPCVRMLTSNTYFCVRILPYIAAVYVHITLSVYVCVCVCTYLGVCNHLYACMMTCICVCTVSVYVYIHIHIYIYIPIYIYIHAHMDVYTCFVYTCTCMYTCMYVYLYV